LSPNQRGGLSVSSSSSLDALPEDIRTNIANVLLTPDANPHHIAEDFNLPLTTILEIYESEETQTLLTRLERMQQRRAEYHINFSKPLAARNLTDILEQSINEEMTCHHRETPEATAMRWRRRETTRRVAMSILNGSALTHGSALHGGRNSACTANQNVHTHSPFAPIYQSPSPFSTTSRLRDPRIDAASTIQKGGAPHPGGCTPHPIEHEAISDRHRNARAAELSVAESRYTARSTTPADHAEATINQHSVQAMHRAPRATTGNITPASPALQNSTNEPRPMSTTDPTPLHTAHAPNPTRNSALGNGSPMPNSRSPPSI
jgi:hypothetical protein